MPFELGELKPFQLHCPSCVRSFSVCADSTLSELLDQMAENGVWCPLGDGETIEDNVYNALAAQDQLYCPECSQPVTISQESLSRIARDLLVHW
jgi:hypothetical protein